MWQSYEKQEVPHLEFHHFVLNHCMKKIYEIRNPTAI